MKNSTIALQPLAPSSRTVSGFLPKQNLARILCLSLAILLSAIPSFAVVILATWASNVPALVPYFQATAWLTGFVFAALALESDRKTTILLVLSAAALFVSAPLASLVSPEFLVVAALVVAAWTGPGVFDHARRIAGC